MKQLLSGPLPDNARNLMRQLGYGEIRNRDGVVSYARRLSGGQFPRFHAYVEDRNGGMQVNLHLDQKEHSIGSGAYHSGEYDGKLVEQEMQWIGATISSWRGGGSGFAGQTHRSATTEPQEEPKGGFWKWLVGGE